MGGESYYSEAAQERLDTECDERSSRRCRCCRLCSPSESGVAEPVCLNVFRLYGAFFLPVEHTLAAILEAVGQQWLCRLQVHVHSHFNITPLIWVIFVLSVGTYC